MFAALVIFLSVAIPAALVYSALFILTMLVRPKAIKGEDGHNYLIACAVLSLISSIIFIFTQP